MVVSNWDPVDVQRHDNWRKELADAGSFAPALAADRLVDGGQFTASLCARRVVWVIAKPESARAYAFMSAAPVLATAGGFSVWHTDASDPRFRAALGCDKPLPANAR